MDSYDLIVIGGGPHGLAHAIRAAKAGARVKLLEARPQLGGRLGAGPEWQGMTTPAFRGVASTNEIAYLRGIGIDPEDLGWTPARQINALGPGGDVLPVPASIELARRAFNERNPFEADRWEETTARAARLFAALSEPLGHAPPAQSNRRSKQSRPGPLDGLFQLLNGPDAQSRAAMAAMVQSLGGFLEGGLTDDLARAVLAGPCLFRSGCNPSDAGSLLSLRGAALSDPNQSRLDLGYVKDTLADATPLLLEALQSAGVDVEMGTAVSDITIEKFRVTGVNLADGRNIAARLVASSLDAKATALGLIDWAQLPDRLVRDIGAVNAPGRTARLLVKLREAPDALLGGGPIYLNTSPHAASLAANTAHLTRVPDAPPAELVTIEDHGGVLLIATLQHVPAKPLGEDWLEAQQRAVLDGLLEMLEPMAEGIKSGTLAWRFDGPRDFETAMGWSHGSPHSTDSEALLSNLKASLSKAVDGLTFGTAASDLAPGASQQVRA